MNNMRIGSFTSSTIWALMTKDRKGTGFGAPGIRLIRNKRYEKRLGKSLDSEIGSKSTSWGTLVEKIAQRSLPFEYNYQSIDTIKHPDIDGWCGTPDYVGNGLVGDIKCPWTLVSFCELVDSIEKNTIKETHPEYYWQLVSNACITRSDMAELTIFCPFLSQLESIRELARSQEEDQHKYTFINFSLDEDLPYILDGGGYKNTYSFKWNVNPEDKQKLTDAVKLALLSIS